MSEISSTPVPAITVGRSLSPVSHTRIPFGVPYGSLCPDGREYGLTMFHMSDSWKFRRRLSPGGAVVLALELDNPETGPHTILVVPVSIFGTFQFTGFVIGSLVFTMLPEPSPLPRDARSFASPRGVCFTLAGSGYIVRMASDMAVAGHARIPGLPPKERRVPS